MSKSTRLTQSNPAQSTRCVIYLRVSSPGQEQDGTSLTSQEELGRAYAARQGWDITQVVREVWSGYDLHERPGLSEVRAAVRGGDVDILLCHSLDRLSRRQAHIAIIADECDRADTRLAFVTEDFEQSAVGEFIRSAKAFAAEIEREKLIERTQRGMRSRVAAGRPLVGPRPPFGYKWVDEQKTRLDLDPDTAPIVQRMFREAAIGVSARQIAIRLSADNIPTPTGRPVWAGSTIRAILYHPVYTGDVTALRWEYHKVHVPGVGQRSKGSKRVDGQVHLPGVAPAMLERDIIDAARQRLPLNQKQAPRNNQHPEMFLLRAGFCRCGYCGRSLTVHWIAGRPYYQCSHQDRYGCPRFGIATAKLDNAVWEKVSQVLTRPDIVAAEIERTRTEDPTAGDLAAIERGIATMARQQHKLLMRLADDDDDDVVVMIKTQLTRLAQDIRQLEADRANLEQARDAWQEAQGRLDDLALWCSNVAAKLGELTYDQKRLALNAVGASARVWRQDHDPRYDLTLRLGIVNTSGC